MRLQIWSSNYDPEPTGIGPVTTSLARSLAERGWDVDVVTAWPHYPQPVWGRRLRPRIERRDGIKVLRLPIWAGRETAGQRIRQEVSHAAALTAALPALGPPLLDRPDVVLAASPSFLALAPALASTRARKVPLVLWLHDLLPDGATESGLIAEGGAILRSSRWLERTAYESATRIVVLADSFRRNLIGKGVPAGKIRLVYPPATRGMPPLAPAPEPSEKGARILSMGNIGHTQEMASMVRAFESSKPLEELEAKLIIAGDGVAADQARSEIRSDRVQMLGVVDDARLESELCEASLALVSQRHSGTEFNLPSKLMNFMAYGLPIVAVVNPESEAARLVRAAEAGWVVDSADPESFPPAVANALTDREALSRRGVAARKFAEREFAPAAFAGAFESLLREATG